MVHALVLRHNPQLAVIVLFGMSILYLIALVLGKAKGLAVDQGMVYVYASFVVVSVVSFLDRSAIALFLPPVVLNIALMLLFGGTLYPGKTPLIQRFMQLERTGDLPPALIGYAHHLTWIWTALFAMMALVSAALALLAPLALWSLFANILNYIFVGILFIGQYLYAYWRYRSYGVYGPWRLAQRMLTTSLADPRHPFYNGPNHCTGPTK